MALGQLGMLAAGFLSGRQQRRDRERSRQEELAHRRALLEMQQRQQEWQQKQQEQEAARRRAEFFKPGLLGPQAPDFLHGLAQMGPEAFENYIRAAGEAFEGAGVPFDPNAYLIQPPRPTLSHVVEGLPGPAGPAKEGPVPVPPEPLPSLAELYRQRYQPGARTQTQQQRAQTAEMLAQARVPLLQSLEDLNRARAESESLMRVPNLTRVLAQAGLADAQAQRTFLLMDPQARLLAAQAQTEEELRPLVMRAQAAALGSLPGFREAQVRLRELEDQTARLGISSRERIADLNRKSREEIAAADRKVRVQLQGARLSPTEQATFRKNLDILTKRITNPSTGKTEWAFDAAHRERALEGLEKAAMRGGLDLTGLGGGDYTSGGGASASAPLPSRRALPAGVTEEMVGAVAGLDAKAYEQYYKNAPPEMKAQIKAARAAALKRRR